MNESNHFTRFDKGAYEDEVKKRWGDTPHYQQSSKRWNLYSSDERHEIQLKGNSLMRAMVGEGEHSLPGDANIQQAIRSYLEYINEYFYDCDANCLKSLSEMWVNDDRFAKTFNKFKSNGAEFVHQAVQIFASDTTSPT